MTDQPTDQPTTRLLELLRAAKKSPESRHKVSRKKITTSHVQNMYVSVTSLTMQYKCDLVRERQPWARW